MKAKTIKKTVIWALSTLFFLTAILAGHIWWVYRPKAPGPFTKVMARIDVRQPVSQNDANKIAAWFGHQKGIDHVLVNAQNRIVIFTYFPVKVSGTGIVKKFNTQLPYHGDRFIPTEKQLAGSCPVAGSSFYYKVYKLIDNIL